MTALLFNPSSLFILLLALFSFHQLLWDFSDYYVLNASIYSEAREPSYSVILLRLKTKSLSDEVFTVSDQLAIFHAAWCQQNKMTLDHSLSLNKSTVWFPVCLSVFFFYIRAPHCGSCHSMEKVEIFFDMLSFCLDVVRCSSPVSCISVNCHMSTRFLVPTVYISAWSIFMAESGITTLSQMNELNLQKKKKKGIMVLIICGFFHCGWLVNI